MAQRTANQTVNFHLKIFIVFKKPDGVYTMVPCFSSFDNRSLCRFIKIEMKGIAAKPDSHGLKRNDLRWSDITEVGIAANEFKKIKLLTFLRGFPKNSFCRYARQ